MHSVHPPHYMPSNKQTKKRSQSLRLAFAVSKLSDPAPDARGNTLKLLRQAHYCAGCGNGPSLRLTKSQEKLFFDSHVLRFHQQHQLPRSGGGFSVKRLPVGNKTKNAFLQLGLPNSAIQKNQRISGSLHLLLSFCSPDTSSLRGRLHL